MVVKAIALELGDQNLSLQEAESSFSRPDLMTQHLLMLALFCSIRTQGVLGGEAELSLTLLCYRLDLQIPGLYRHLMFR